MKNATIIAMTFATLLTSGLMAGNASANSTCYTYHVAASGSSAGAIAKFRKRRAERRAKRAWEKKVAKQYGGRYADFDQAIRPNIKFGVTSRGNTSATASGKITVCH